MRRLLLALCLFACAINFPLQSQEQQTKALGHYLFAWTGDAAHKGNDFLAVIDADPASISYGHLMTTIATDQRTVRIHHTEYVMPASGMLFANDHDAGRTFIFRCARPAASQNRDLVYRHGRLYASSLLPAAAQRACARHLPARASRRERRRDGRQRRIGGD